MSCRVQEHEAHSCTVAEENSVLKRERAILQEQQQLQADHHSKLVGCDASCLDS